MTLTLIDFWAVCTAAFASIFLAMRSNLLKPELTGFASAGTPVRLALFFLSVVLAGAVISIARAGHATAREATVYTALAISSGVLFANLRRQTEATSSPEPRR